MDNESLYDCENCNIIQGKFNKLKVLYRKQKQQLDESSKKETESDNELQKCRNNIKHFFDEFTFSLNGSTQLLSTFIRELSTSLLPEENKFHDVFDFLVWKDQFCNKMYSNLNENSQFTIEDMIRKKEYSENLDFLNNHSTNSPISDNELLKEVLNLKKSLRTLQEEYKAYQNEWRNNLDTCKRNNSSNANKIGEEFYLELFPDLNSADVESIKQKIKELHQIKLNKSKETEVNLRTIKNLKCELDDYVNSLKIKTSEINQLKDMIRDLNNTSENLAQQSKDLLLEKETMRERLTSIEASYQEKSRDYSANLIKLKTLEEDYQAVKVQLNLKNNSVSGYSNEIESLRAEIEQIKKESADRDLSLKNKLDSVSSERDSLSERLDEVSRQFVEFKKKAHSALSTRERDSEKSIQNKNLQSLELAMCEKDKELAVITEKLNKSLSRINDLQTRLKVQDLKQLQLVEKHKADLESLQEEFARKSNEAQTAKDLQDRYDKIKDELELVKLNSEKLDDKYQKEIQLQSETIKNLESLLKEKTSEVKEIANVKPAKECTREERTSKSTASESPIEAVSSSTHGIGLLDSKIKLTPFNILLENEKDENYFGSSSSYSIDHMERMLEVERKRNKHLSQTLHESELMVMTMTEESKVLKEEIRRLERDSTSSSRDFKEDYFGHFEHQSPSTDAKTQTEYLKNVLLKFISLPKESKVEKNKLLPVLSTLLKASPQEKQLLKEFVEHGHCNPNQNTWLSYLWK